MPSCTIITLGRLRDKYWIEAEAEYVKRLSPFCKMQYKELAPEKLPENASGKQIEQALDKEADRILELLAKKSPSSLVIALCIEGRQMDSEGLAEVLGRAGEIYFIIGSSHGLSDRVKSAADLKLSLSAMTFPHQLARIMLVEQIYRTFTILNNRKYHK